MIKTGKKLITKLLLIATCTSLIPTSLSFAEENKNTQEIGSTIIETTGSAVSINDDTINSSATVNNNSDVVETTDSSVSVSSESDFDFDSTTGTIKGYNGSDTDVVIPNEINGVKVTSIGDNAFNENFELKSITIPNGVTSIGYYAFYDCFELAKITIPDSVTSIGACAFSYCSSLTDIKIPNGVTNIGIATFSCCHIKSITIPQSVTSIGAEAFQYCSNLTDVTISNGVINIDSYAFSGCSNLKSIAIPDSVTSMGAFVFENCSNLTDVKLSNNLTAIGSYAFVGCSNLTTITIPNSVTDIAPFAFLGCSSLAIVNIPNSVTTIGNQDFMVGTAFQDCDNAIFYVENENTKQLLINDGIDESRIILNNQSSSVGVTSITLNTTSLDLKKGNTSTLTSTVLPDNATNKKVTWASSNTNVATVDENGKVTGVSPGSSTITCAAGDGSGQSATCLVTVTNPTVKVSSIRLSIKYGNGNQFTLIPTINPSNATNKEVTWTSSNTKVATVDSNGKVTYVGKGSATITCKAKDGSGVSASMFVKNDYYGN